MSPEEEKHQGLTRDRLVAAAIELIHQDGLDSLSMRSLADRLQVKAASLYWHVRDRRELLELLAESILEGLPRVRRGPGWRETILAGAESLRRRLAAQQDATRILLEVPESLEQSAVFAEIRAQLVAAGLRADEAREVALMVLASVLSTRAPAEPRAGDSGLPASIAIDSGSRGVILRAGPPEMEALIRVPPDQSGAAPAVVRGEQVVVRRLRGVGRGEIELNPRRPWKFKVQAPTWNTVLDVGGLDVREVHVDSGASNLECFLPQPRGVVPLRISGGVVHASVHRPREAAVVAVVRTGAVKVKLDDYSTKVAIFDVHWQSEGAAQAPDRYDLEVSSGAVDFRLDTYTPSVQRLDAAPAEPRAGGKAASALEILLDGVEARLKVT